MKKERVMYQVGQRRAGSSGWALPCCLGFAARAATQSVDGECRRAGVGEASGTSGTERRWGSRSCCTTKEKEHFEMFPLTRITFIPRAGELYSN